MDTFLGLNWVLEPYIKGEFWFRDQQFNIHRTFRHSNYLRLSMTSEPFTNFTCHHCMGIPQEHDFRIRVRKEEFFLDKRSDKSLGGVRKLGYLQVLELASYICLIFKKYKNIKAAHWI